MSTGLPVAQVARVPGGFTVPERVQINFQNVQPYKPCFKLTMFPGQATPTRTTATGPTLRIPWCVCSWAVLEIPKPAAVVERFGAERSGPWAGQKIVGTKNVGVRSQRAAAEPFTPPEATVDLNLELEIITDDGPVGFAAVGWTPCQVHLHHARGPAANQPCSSWR